MGWKTALLVTFAVWHPSPRPLSGACSMRAPPLPPPPPRVAVAAPPLRALQCGHLRVFGGPRWRSRVLGPESMGDCRSC